MPNDPAPSPTPAPTPTPPIESKPPTADPPPPAPKEGEPAPKEPAAPDPALDTKINPLKVEEIKFSGEGLTVDPEVGNAFAAIVNEHGIPRDVVAKLVSLQEKTMTAASETNSRAWTEMQEKWTAEVQKDPDIGGSNWPETESKIGQLLETFGTPELREAFDLTGAGNNPHVVRFMSKVAKTLTEGGFISATLPPTGGKTAAQILYPNQGKT